MSSVKIKSCDYDNYKDYKKAYDKHRNEVNKEKNKKYREELRKKNPNIYKEQYEKRKQYNKQYYQEKRKNEDWIEEQKIKCNEYKKNNKKTLAEYTREYRKSYNGCRAHKFGDWKKNNLKMTDDEYSKIFDRWYSSVKCELCNEEYNKKNQKCMDHHHSSGSFRNICCNKCNIKLANVDRQKDKVLLELHRYMYLR